MKDLLTQILLCSVLATCLVIVMHKWGVVDYMRDLRARYAVFSGLPSDCDFCLSFWASVLITMVMAVTSLIDVEIMTILVPFGSAAVAQKLLR